MCELKDSPEKWRNLLLRVQENLFTDFTFESFTLTKWGVIKVGFESPWDLRCRYNLITIIEWWNCFVKSLKCKKRCFPFVLVKYMAFL